MASVVMGHSMLWGVNGPIGYTSKDLALRENDAAVKLVLSLAATLQLDGQHSMLIAVHDVSVAFFHAEMDESVVIIPPKGEESPGIL